MKIFTVINEFYNKCMNTNIQPDYQFEVEYELRKYIKRFWWRIKLLPEVLLISTLKNKLDEFYITIRNSNFKVSCSIHKFEHHDGVIDYIIYIDNIIYRGYITRE